MKSNKVNQFCSLVLLPHKAIMLIRSNYGMKTKFNSNSGVTTNININNGVKIISSRIGTIISKNSITGSNNSLISTIKDMNMGKLCKQIIKITSRHIRTQILSTTTTTNNSRTPITTTTNSKIIAKTSKQITTNSTMIVTTIIINSPPKSSKKLKKRNLVMRTL